MKPTRLLQSVAQVVKPARTLLPRSVAAGPSTIPSNTRTATTTALPFQGPASTRASAIPHIRTKNDDLDPTSLELPGNLRFEGFDDPANEAPPRGLVLHTSGGPLAPIVLPLSSLASSTPTLAAPSGETIALDPAVFGLPIRRDILHRNVIWYLSTLRQGNQSTKTRSTVAYSGRKLRRQKGTGMARVGDASSGTRRGGAPIFPLHPRDHAQLLPRKVRSLGLRTALSSKLASGLLRVVPDLHEAGWGGTGEARRALCDVDQGVEVVEKTMEDGSVVRVDVRTGEPFGPFDGMVWRFGTPKDLSILFVHPPEMGAEGVQRLEKFVRTVRNLPDVEVLSADEVTVWHILKYRWCVLERGAVEAFGGEMEGEEEMEMLLGDEAGGEAQVEVRA